ncbi:hypothetical protein GE09DRAFT_22480 [Coniochaeta sp. 2T2.1]|nr:hypothetical protein GE09DRAFT_22480 [Coniochaeta sp. 2T2.1]
MSSPSEQTILVTGANGFIGGHVLQQALAKGYNVVAAVRTAKSASKFRPIFSSQESSGQLTWAYVPDITVVPDYASAFSAAEKPITGILHLASPFSLSVEDNKRDLLEPAVHGSLAILQAANKYATPALKRVVITSSFASNLDTTKGSRPGYTYTDADWNPQGWETADMDSSSAYCASKALAEKAAWDFIEEEKPGFDLVSINPPWVFGPHVDGVEDLAKLNQSSAALSQLLDAKAIPPVDFGGFVDARDIAAAHILALEKPEAGGNRFIVGSHFDYQSAADALRKEVPELRERIPEGTPGKLPEVYGMDGSRAERVLGIKYRTLGETMRDAFAEYVKVKPVAA